MKLFVHHARGSRHPLHVAGTYQPASTRGIPVRDLPAIGKGYRLKTSVGMLTHTALMRARIEPSPRRMIEQKERTLAARITGR